MGTASIYVRLSKQPQDSNLSYAGMLADCRALAAREGYAVYSEYADLGESGESRDREGFDSWLFEARRGHVDALVTWDLDRASRAGIGHLAQLLDISDGIDIPRRVRLLDCAGLDSDAPGEQWRLLFAFKGEYARQELQRIKRRNQARSARLAAARRHHGKRPYGFDIVPATGGGKTLEIREDEAAVLLRIAELVHRGERPHNIATRLSHEGIPTPRGAAQWSAQTVTALMRRPINAGIYSHRKHPAREEDGSMVRVYPEIISEAMWLEVVDRLRPTTRQDRSTRGRPPRLLTGYTVCGGCDGIMQRQYRASAEPLYRCTRQGCLDKGMIPADVLEEHVTEELLNLFGSVRLAREVMVNTSRAEAERLESRKAQLLARLAEDASDADALRELVDVQEQARGLTDSVERQVVVDSMPFRDRWRDAATEDERRELLSRAVERVVITKGRRLSGTPRDQLHAAYLERVTIEWSDLAEGQRDAQLSEEWERHGPFE